MLPLAPLIEGIAGFVFGFIPTAFEVTDAFIREDYGSVPQEIGFDVGGEVTDNILDGQGFPKIGGYAWGGVDIAMDINSLSGLESEYESEAVFNVNLQVNQAETAFMSAQFATIPPGPMSVQAPYSSQFTGPWAPGYNPNHVWWQPTP
jgi:hypothetical protein